MSNRIGRGLCVQAAGIGLGLVVLILPALGWWIRAVAVAALSLIPIFSMRRAV